MARRPASPPHRADDGSAAPQLLVIAGLDPSGGAGLLADAAVIGAHGLRAVGVLSASTVQDTTGVRAVHPMPADIVAAQVRELLVDAQPRAVKIGMLASEATARAVAEALAGIAVPVVWDPVLMPTRGQVTLFDGDPRAAFLALAPVVSVLTPNTEELAVLTGLPVTGEAEAIAAAMRLVGDGAHAVLAKGGHLGGPESVDWLVTAGAAPLRLASPRCPAPALHGTGCVLASALASELALGRSLPEAARLAKGYLDACLLAPLASGRGAATLV